jgi:hypothetical protein
MGKQQPIVASRLPIVERPLKGYASLFCMGFGEKTTVGTVCIHLGQLNQQSTCQQGKKEGQSFQQENIVEERKVLTMNHTRSPHVSRRASGGICPQSAFIGWLEDLLKLVFAPTAQQPPKRGRPLSLTEPHLWLCILVGVLHGAHSFQAFWRLLVVEPLGSFPLLAITDEAVRKRLLTLSSERLCPTVSAALRRAAAACHLPKHPAVGLLCDRSGQFR